MFGGFYKLRSKFQVVGFCVLLAILFSLQSVQVQAASKSSRASDIQDQLEELGYDAEVDSDDDVVFKVDELTFLVILSEDDDEFYTVTLPNIDEVDEDEVGVRLVALLGLTGKCKGIKFFIVGDTKVYISYEGCYSSVRRFNKVLPRIIETIQSAYQLYNKQVLEDDEDDEDDDD